ncbi:MAG TPA: hypothetical protein VJ810_10955 [Blastocatellia bacterium]|nr:hypothetical protein [Blastocatellia bacterium]
MTVKLSVFNPSGASLKFEVRCLSGLLTSCAYGVTGHETIG